MSHAIASRVVPLAGVTVVLLGAVVTTCVAVANGQDLEQLEFIPLLISYGTVGAAIVARRPSNRVGWLFLASGVMSAFGLLAKAVGTAAIPEGHNASSAAVLAAWFSLIYVELVELPIALTFLVFPHGRFLSRGWLVVGVLTIAMSFAGATMVAISDVDFAFTPDPVNQPANFPGMQHPLMLVGTQTMLPWYSAYQLTMVVLILACTAGLVVRYRRSAGAERLQVRWVLAAVVLAVSGFVVSVVAGITTGADVITVAFAVLFPLIPIACGVAILRYRLYDIDRLISRTASYAIVTGAALATYAVIVTSATRLLPSGSSPIVVAGATLAAAALVRPLLRRVQGVVDRRFNRSRYDAAKTVDEFGLRLRGVVDVDATVGDLLEVVLRTMAPSSVGLARAGGTVER